MASGTTNAPPAATPDQAGGADQAAAKEAEKQEIARLMAEIGAEVVKMKGLPPGNAEAMHEQIKARCADTRLPPEFKKQILALARSLECEANMKATDEALKAAIDLAQAERMQERAVKLGEARAFHGKARLLGADEGFLRATMRRIETAMMTGGVYKPGAATKAKPVDLAPANPRSAK